MSEVKTDSVVNVSGDNDSGIDLSTNDVVVIKTADTERMQVNSSGTVIVKEAVQFGDDAQTYIKGAGANDVDLLASGDTNIRFETGTNERMRIDSDGGLRVGTTTNIFNLSSTEHASIKNPGQGNALTLQSTNVTGGFPILYLSSTDTTASQNAIVFQRTGGGVGTISTSASATAYNTTSDHRLKENVADMTGAIARVKSLAPKRFNFIVDTTDTLVDGFIAHEAQTVVPEAVTGTHNEVDDDGNAVMQGIDQAKLVPLLTGALQEAIAKIEALEARVTALEDA